MKLSLKLKVDQTQTMNNLPFDEWLDKKTRCMRYIVYGLISIKILKNEFKIIFFSKYASSSVSLEITLFNVTNNGQLL